MITLLIGHRGTGKTTLLKRLEVIFARQEGVVLKDLDREIAAREQRSIASIFETSGEAAFRDLERQVFAELMSDYGSHEQVFISVGAGFDFPIPKDARVVWVRRPSDALGRIFLDRPRLTDKDPLTEWRDIFSEREPRFRTLAHEELMLPEGNLHDFILEDHFFASSRAIPFATTALPENFRSPDFFERRRGWNLKWLEIRDDLLSEGQIAQLQETWSQEKLLYSIRNHRSDRPAGSRTVDWALELGPPPFPVEILSRHERIQDLRSTLLSFPSGRPLILKLAVEVQNFSELLEGHRWWREKPNARAFLPCSKDGRWQWYRQLFGPQMPIHFFREGDGSSADQPYLWQTLTVREPSNGFAAILGSPVMRSWTPTFQREFFEPRGIPVVAIDVSENEWETALPILWELGLRFAAVTSPLKQKAFACLEDMGETVRRFKSVNTLAWTGSRWSGDNTDFFGAERLLRDEFKNPADLIVWGGGGTKAILESLLPKAEFVSARAGKKLTKAAHLVWAVGRTRDFAWPQPAVFIQSVVDLNYAEDSPGREIAWRAGSPYKSGETMFIQQGLKQREFWKKYL